MAGEKAGVPSVGIMTSAFVSAAELMARVLGAEGYPFAVIEHPVSSANLDKLAEQARLAAERSRDLLVGAAS